MADGEMILHFPQPLPPRKGAAAWSYGPYPQPRPLQAGLPVNSRQGTFLPACCWVTAGVPVNSGPCGAFQPGRLTACCRLAGLLAESSGEPPFCLCSVSMHKHKMLLFPPCYLD